MGLSNGLEIIALFVGIQVTLYYHFGLGHGASVDVYQRRVEDSS